MSMSHCFYFYCKNYRLTLFMLDSSISSKLFFLQRSSKSHHCLVHYWTARGNWSTVRKPNEVPNVSVYISSCNTLSSPYQHSGYCYMIINCKMIINRMTIISFLSVWGCKVATTCRKQNWNDDKLAKTNFYAWWQIFGCYIMYQACYKRVVTYWVFTMNVSSLSQNLNSILN
jgi:hypothetical protein